MWTKANPPPKSRYTKGNPVRVHTNTDTPRARIHEQMPGKTGAAVLYRDHVKGFLHYDKRLQRHIDVALPKPLYKTLEKYEGVPDERVPPLIAVMRKRREVVQTDWKRQVQIRQYCFIVLPGKVHRVYCFVQGTMAFFVEEDLVLNRLRCSYAYTADIARAIAMDERKILRLRWKDSCEIPDQAAK